MTEKTVVVFFFYCISTEPDDTAVDYFLLKL